MRIRTLSIALLLAGVCTLTWFVRDAEACSCALPGAPCQAAFTADAVFSATVTAVDPVPEDGPPLPPGTMRIPRVVRVALKDVERYLGSGPAPSFVLTAGSGPACGYTFKVGTRYLIYAHRGADGVLATGICSRTAPVADAGEDLRFLRSLPPPTSGLVRLSGAALHKEHNPGADDYIDYGAVQGVYVQAQGPAGTASAWTDAAGRYELRLPPGKYEISASPPEKYSTRYLRYSIELRDPRGCFAADFHLRFDGRVAGRIRAPGDTPGDVVLELIPENAIGKKGRALTLKATSERDGSFEFIEVPPGRYLLATGFSRPLQAEIMFPTTFFPGTANDREARVIELGGGERIRLEQMSLPAPRRPLRLTGQVVHADGRPAAGVNISLWDGEIEWQQVARGSTTAADGTFSFLVHEGLSYLARASLWDNEARRSLSARSAPVIASEEMTPIRLVLTADKIQQP